MPDYSYITDLELISLLMKKDHSAFTEIYNKHWRFMAWSISTELPVGDYNLEIKANDMFGRAFIDKRLIHIGNPKPSS